MLRLLKSNCIVYHPSQKNYVSGNFDPQRYSSIDMARAHVITYEMLLDDEITQILGVTHFGDAAECGASFVTMWSVNEFIQLIRWGQVSNLCNGHYYFLRRANMKEIGIKRK